MGRQDFRQTLAKLLAAVALQEAQIIADPLPWLKKASDRMTELQQTLLDVETALCDDNWVYDDATKLGIPVDCYKADTDRIAKARAILSRYING